MTHLISKVRKTMRNDSIAFLFLIVCFNSCLSDNRQCEETIVLNYKSGEKKTETIFYSDSVHKNCLKEYYENGSLKLSGCYRNQLKEGEFKNFYASGTLHSEISYTNGLINGSAIKYHENGLVAMKVDYKNDKESGPGYIYRLGGSLSAFVFYQESNLTYRINYNEAGRITDVVGSPFSYVEISTDRISIEDSLDVKVKCITPLGSIPLLTVEKTKLEGSLKTGLFKKRKIYSDELVFKDVANEVGLWKYELFLFIQLENDSIFNCGKSFEFTVSVE